VRRMSNRPPLRFRTQVVVTRFATGLLKRAGLRDRVITLRWQRARRKRLAAEAVGIDRLSRPALHGLDMSLNAIIDCDGGFFVEAGGNDGFTQSNTYWLERFRGWSGILVEPMPELAEHARIERPSSRVFQCALVPADRDGGTVLMHFGDLMSSVTGAHGDATADTAWIEPGLVLGWRDPYDVEVPARSLSSVLDEAGAPEIDLLSLDVEGYEEQVLRGLDLTRHAPRWIVIEAHDVEAGRSRFEVMLGERYVLHAQLSPVDLLYRRSDAEAAASA
jgi:FkbM family methyltransferase